MELRAAASPEAPPVVGCVAYLGVTSGRPDLFAQMLLGYGLLQALMLVRLERWLRAPPFVANAVVGRIALRSIRLLLRGALVPPPLLAPPPEKP